MGDKERARFVIMSAAKDLAFLARGTRDPSLRSGRRRAAGVHFWSSACVPVSRSPCLLVSPSPCLPASASPSRETRLELLEVLGGRGAVLSRLGRLPRLRWPLSAPHDGIEVVVPVFRSVQSMPYPHHSHDGGSKAGPAPLQKTHRFSTTQMAGTMPGKAFRCWPASVHTLTA